MTGVFYSYNLLWSLPVFSLLFLKYSNQINTWAAVVLISWSLCF